MYLQGLNGERPVTLNLERDQLRHNILYHVHAFSYGNGSMGKYITKVPHFLVDVHGDNVNQSYQSCCLP